MKLISETVESGLIGLYGLCFVGNSICDNIVTQLDVDFVMPNTSEIVHYGLAHAMPAIADVLGEYAAARNSSLSRPGVLPQTEKFSNLTEAFSKILDYMIGLEKETARVIDIALSENDKTTAKFLDSFLLNLIPLTKISIALCDYVEKNGDEDKDHMQIDSNIKKFIGKITKYEYK